MSSKQTLPAISVEGLGKEYVLGGEDMHYESFRELLLNLLAAPIRRFKTLARKSESAPRFWALKDVNFSVKKGEVVGIIGKNGAGKSTLLKVLSRITAPTEGEVTYRGRVASLLEVGTGFHPEFTGKENIYLNGSILGMTSAEVDARLDEIVQFAGIEQFLNTPVKRYSSGMYVRLAFSVAAHMDPDILIVDEVLAVGDAEFQKKCLGKLGDVSRGGRTVLFVSHNMNSIRSLCSRAICLRDGKIVSDGDPNQVIGEYIKQSRINRAEWHVDGPDMDTGKYLKKIKIENSSGTTTNLVDHDDSAQISIEYRQPENPEFIVAVRIADMYGNVLFTSWDVDYLKTRPTVSGDICRTQCKINSHLLRPGDYTLSVFIRIHSQSVVQELEEVDLQLSVSEKGSPLAPGRIGLVAPKLQWQTVSSSS